MRLLYVTARAPFGRDETFVMDEVHALLARGHRVTLVPLLPQGGHVHGLATTLLPRTLAVSPWSLRVLGAAALEFARAPRAALQALGLLMTPRPGLLLKHLALYPKALWLARRLRLLGIDHLHAHWATAPAALAMAAARAARVPWSFTAHRYDLLDDQLFARKAAQASFVRVISSDGERRARELCGAAARIVRIPMGVRLPAPRAPTRGRATLRLLCPARLVPVKGHDVLIDSVARVEGPLELWLAGAGPERRAIEARIRSRYLRNVRLLGHLPRERVLALYRRREVDAVVLASAHEGIPVALMEAMAYGLPVLATAVGGTPELLADGAGLLVPAGDRGALAKALDQLRDASLRARLGAKARARIASGYCIGETAGALSACFAAHVADSRNAAGIRKRTSARYSATYAATNTPKQAARATSWRHSTSAGSAVPTSNGPA